MFPAGSVEDRLARAIYGEAPAFDRSGARFSFDAAALRGCAEVGVACLQAAAAAEVLAGYQQVWVELMAARMAPAAEVALPELFPEDSEDVSVCRRAFADGVPDDYCPRRAGRGW